VIQNVSLLSSIQQGEGIYCYLPILNLKKKQLTNYEVKLIYGIVEVCNKVFNFLSPYFFIYNMNYACVEKLYLAQWFITF
jgi:hypothetical protein